MEFCDRCGGLMIPQIVGKTKSLVCRKCGKRRAIKSTKEFKVKTPGVVAKDKVVVVEKKHRLEVLPVTTAHCPKCENTKAYWWMHQTRSADEPPTRFFKCNRCGHVWREYE